MSFRGVICFAGEDWWYHNRGHYDMQIMRRFARRTRVLFVNSIVAKPPRLSRGSMFWPKFCRKMQSIGCGLKEVESGLFVCSPPSVPLHHYSWGRQLNDALVRAYVSPWAADLGMRNPLVWVECPAACGTAFRLSRAALVYQRTDLHEAYRGGDDQITSYHRALMRRSDLVVYVSRKLYEQEREGCRNALLSDHGVDFDLFDRARRSQGMPADVRGIPRPIAGYFGSVSDHTVDFDLLADVSRNLHQVSFVLIGPASCDVSLLQKIPNVYLLGQKPYEQIPAYGSCFDVALMPWRQTRWIDVCNPVKLKEYLALGKPVVSTPYSELLYYPGYVYIASGAVEFAQAIMRAIREADLGRAEERRRFVSEATWDRVASTVWDALPVGLG